MPAPVSDPAENAAVIERLALELGFARVGFAPVGPVERHAVYLAWLAAGRAGEMSYLQRDAGPRRDPALVPFVDWPDSPVRTVITVALSYAHPDSIDVPLDRLAGGPRGTIARYARGADYHVVLKDKLRALAAALAQALGRPFAFRAAVDTAPLLERELALRGGLGFLAKNTMLIAPGQGSFLLLGELLTDLECAPSSPPPPRCGQCRACLDACPTGAFVDGYTLDARRCISYLTIELVGAIPRELRPLVGDRVFGCDVCQDVCPFNAGALPAGAPELAPRPGYARPSLRRLLGLGAAQFRKWQAKSALRRIHRPQLLRNVCVALGNVGGPDELPHLARALEEPHPLVRTHAAWAIGAIARRHPSAGDEARGLLEARMAVETDASVREELASAVLDT